MTAASQRSGATPARRLILLRHGQTEYNAGDRMQGQLDTDLSELGRVQAKSAARALVERGPAEIVSSDLRRALDTATALGVSRVVTAAGWRPHHEQVGQTGTRISPDLYIPCGISGAIQHWAGCSSAKTILAINTDAEAPMVTRATYAVIGDLHEVVPAINEEIRRRRG